MREARRRAREAEDAWRAAQKASAAQAARLEVDAHEAHLEELTSIHRECIDPVDWQAMASQPAPQKPHPPGPVSQGRSLAARRALEGYRPSFFERLLGLTSRKIQLELAVSRALAAEASAEVKAREQHLSEVEEWESATEDWRASRDLAQRVLRGDLNAYEDAIRSTDCLAELAGVLGVGELPLQLTAERAELTPMTVAPLAPVTVGQGAR